MVSFAQWKGKVADGLNALFEECRVASPKCEDIPDALYRPLYESGLMESDAVTQFYCMLHDFAAPHNIKPSIMLALVKSNALKVTRK